MDLSIVIVSYNTRDVIFSCLNSIVHQTNGLEYEIIVVDNASTDDSVEMIRNKFPSVTLVCNSENRGFASAQNIGLRCAHGRFLLILNSDVLFVGNTAKRMVEHLQNGPSDAGVIGPQILNPDGTAAPSARRSHLSKPMIVLSIINRYFNFKRYLPESFLRKHFGFILANWHDNYACLEHARQVDFVDGMCVLVKREALEQAGLFDEQFFFDYEITDLSNRIRVHGWKIEFFPGAQAIHLPHSSRKKNPQIIFATCRSELVYYSKYSPDYIPIIKYITYLIIAMKIFWHKTVLLFRKNNHNSIDFLNIYKIIFSIYRDFDSSAVINNKMVPSLDKLVKK